jgi:flagellar hook-associated protein 1 FlgK
MEQMNEWIRNFSEAFNKILEAGYTSSGAAGSLMFTGDAATSGQYTFGTAAQKAVFYGTGTGTTISSSDDSYYMLTAVNFNLSKALVNDADKLATKTSTSVTDGTSQYDNITAIVAMLTDKDKMSFRGATAGDFLTSLLGDISLNKDNANTFSTNYKTLENTLENQRVSVSGVDSDEEALSLVQYQNSYTLSSKVISTMTEMYDQLILRTGV